MAGLADAFAVRPHPVNIHLKIQPILAWYTLCTNFNELIVDLVANGRIDDVVDIAEWVGEENNRRLLQLRLAVIGQRAGFARNVDT